MRPFNVYYGWVQVVLASVAMTATLPGRTYGLGLIKEPLRRDLGIGDVEFSLLNFWAIILGAAAVLPVGKLIDRYGSRPVGTLVALLLAASVAAMGRAQSETELMVALTCVRGLGQGALSVVAIAMVGKWFRKRAPLAMGLFSVLLGIGFVIPLGPLKSVIALQGWRTGWEVVSYWLIGFAAVAALVTRSSPERLGVPPDEPVEEADSARPSSGLLAALSTPAFWVYTAVGSMFALAFSAVTLDNELLLKERALAEADIETGILGTLFVSGLAANLVAGGLTNRLRLPRLLAVGTFALAGAMFAFPFVQSSTGALAYATLLGLGGGVVTVVFFAIYGREYGRKHLGAIQAAAQVCSVFASAIGPVLLSQCRQTFARTDTFFYACGVSALVLGGLCWVVRPASSKRS